MNRPILSGPPSPEEFQKQLSDFVRQHFQNLRGAPAPEPGPRSQAKYPTPARNDRVGIPD